MTRELEQTDRQTALLTTQVKASLIASDVVDAAAILVSLEKSVVVLSGFVASQAESDEALRLAQSSSDGSAVINRLMVR